MRRFNKSDHRRNESNKNQRQNHQLINCVQCAQYSRDYLSLEDVAQ